MRKLMKASMPLSGNIFKISFVPSFAAEGCPCSAAAKHRLEGAAIGVERCVMWGGVIESASAVSIVAAAVGVVFVVCSFS